MIIRAPRPTANYTVVPNAAIRDQRLSWKARGLLIYLLSMPDNWRTNTTQLRGAGIDGRDAIRAGLTELEEAGYLHRRRIHRNDGTFTWATIVFDTAHNPVDNAGDYWSPETGYPATVNPSSKEVLREQVLSEQVSKTSYIGDRKVCGRCNGSGLYASRSTGKILKCPVCTDGTVKAIA